MIWMRMKKTLLQILSIMAIQFAVFGIQAVASDHSHRELPPQSLQAIELGDKIEKALARNYPRVNFKNETVYSEDNAERALILFPVLLQVIEQKKLKSEITKIWITTSEPGALKKSSEGAVAILNLGESYDPTRWQGRLSGEVTLPQVVCGASTESYESLRDFFARLRKKDGIPSGFKNPDFLAHEIDLNKEPKLLVDLLFQVLRLENDARPAFNGAEIAPEILASAHGCKSFECVLKAVFGSEELGLLIAKIQLQYGMNASFALDPTHYENWDLAVLKIIETALSEMPRFVFEIMAQDTMSGHNPYTLVLSKDRRRESEEVAVFGNSSMKFYQRFLVVSPIEMKGFVYHELSHHLYQPLSGHSYTGWKEWESLSGWQPLPEAGWKHDPQSKNFVSWYAESRNPEEDFAESMRAYRYDPALLLKVAPEKYQFIKTRVFKGIEYVSEQACRASN